MSMDVKQTSSDFQNLSTFKHIPQKYNML